MSHSENGRLLSNGNQGLTYNNMSEFQNNFPNKSIKNRAQILFYLYKILESAN